MFSKETYIRRRAELKQLVGEGVIVLFGNNEAPYNYPANAYAPMRQDSSFLYFFGQHRDGLVGVIDIDNDEEWLLGDDIDVEDIVWMGFTPSVADLASEVGIVKTAPMSQLKAIVNGQSASGRQVHFLPPYRFDTKIQIMDLLGIHPAKQKECASTALIQAVVKMRSTKEVQEIEAIDRACDIGYAMHTTAQLLIKPGVTERFVGGQVDGTCTAPRLRTNWKQGVWPFVTQAANWTTIVQTTPERCLFRASSASVSWRYTPLSRLATTMCYRSPNQA